MTYLMWLKCSKATMHGRALASIKFCWSLKGIPIEVLRVKKWVYAPAICRGYVSARNSGAKEYVALL